MTRLATDVAKSSRQAPDSAGRLAWIRRPATLVLLWYLCGGFFVTLRMWIPPGGVRQAGDPADVNQATWFIRYTATAIEHFRLPALNAVTMNAPHSVNLMWNTSLLLPGIVMTPVTAAFGPQLSLTLLLVIGFAGSAASMYYVLRRWDASPIAAALGGALYGFSPALVDSGIGHFSLVLAMLPPLMIDRVLSMVTGRGHTVRHGLWLGLMVAAQLFISEELLVDTVIAVVIMLVVLALCHPHEVLSRIRPLATGLACAAVVALVLCARALWVQFHGVHATTAAATVIISYDGAQTNLGTLPYAFINPSSGVLLHTSSTMRIADGYPQPLPEYLAFLGVPLIILLLVAIVYFWKNITIRVAGITCILLEWLAMGAAPIRPHTFTLPKFLLPWQAVQHLPVISGMVPDRLCILADAGAAVVLAFALDLARNGSVPLFARLRNGPAIATGIAAFALLFIVPTPYGVAKVNPLPAGWTATFRALHLPQKARVLLAPYPYAGTSQLMRWQADTGYPATMIGGDFMAPGVPQHLARAGRSAMTPTSYYIDYLYANTPNVTAPPAAQIRADLAKWEPNAVVAIATPASPLGTFLIRQFGQPTTHIGAMLGWAYKPGAGYASG